MALTLTTSDKFLLLHAFGTPETRDRVVTLLELAGSGDVAGPVSSTDGALVRFDGTTGLLLQSSPIVISDLGVLTAPQLTTPSNPASGTNSLYFKSDNKLYKLTSAGVESEVGAAVGSGDVVGPASATNEAITIYDGTTGKLIKNSAVTINGDQLSVNTVGKGLSIKGGANAKVGLHTLTGVGTDTVLNSSVTANSIIMVTPQVFGGTPVRQPMVNNIVPGVSFDLLYTTADTSTVAYFIVETT